MAQFLLEKELETYKHQRDHFLATAAGKFVLIHADKILGVYESQMDAITQGYRQLGDVPFLVKQIVPVEVPETFVSSLLGV